MIARLWNKFYAYLNGYFWLPCPLCGENFGAHEWKESIYRGYGLGTGVCGKQKCMGKAAELSEQVRLCESINMDSQTFRYDDAKIREILPLNIKLGNEE